MSFSVLLHPGVAKFLDSPVDGERRRCYEALKKLGEDPFQSRAGCDIRKMHGRKVFYRLRVGEHRFLYLVEEGEVLVEEAFKRGRGYQVREEPD